MKYIIYFDYMAEAKKSYEYRPLAAKNLEEAIAEADKAIEENTEPIYLTRILKKDGKIEKEAGTDLKRENFEAILCRRSHGWHQNNKKNYEAEHFAKRLYNREIEFFGAYTKF